MLVPRINQFFGGRIEGYPEWATTSNTIQLHKALN